MTILKLFVFLVILSGIPFAVGCMAGGNIEDYKATVRSARKVLPVAVEMEKLFPVADHFITHYGIDRGPLQWNTEVFFGGRYELTMQVDVQVDYKTNTITKIVGEPVFYLRETKKIDILPDGRAQSWYREQGQRQFSIKEWRKICENKGDLSAIDVKLDSTKVPNFDEGVAQTRRDRIQVSLVAPDTNSKDK